MRNLYHRGFCLGVIALWMGMCSSGAVERSASEVWEAWLEQQSEIKSLQVDFTQTRQWRSLQRELTSQGAFYWTGDERWRWQIGEFPEQIALRNAQGLFLIEPRKRRARQLEDNGERSAEKWWQWFMPAQARERWLELFTVSRKRIEKGVLKVSLVPRDPTLQEQLRSAELEILPRSLRLRLMRLDFVDRSRVEYTMRRMMIDAPIADSFFEYDLSGYRVKK